MPGPADGGFLSEDAAILSGDVSSAEGVLMSDEDGRFPANGVFLSREHVFLSAAVIMSAEDVLPCATEGVLWREVEVSETCMRKDCSAAMPPGGFGFRV